MTRGTALDGAARLSAPPGQPLRLPLRPPLPGGAAGFPVRAGRMRLAFPVLDMQPALMVFFAEILRGSVPKSDSKVR